MPSSPAIVASGRTIVVAAFVALAAPGVANADFLDQSVRLDYRIFDLAGGGGDILTSSEAIVSAATIEFANFNPDGPTFDVDLDATGIHVGNFSVPSLSSDTFGAFDFLGLALTLSADAGLAFDTVTVVSGQHPMVGLAVTHTGDAIEMNWAGLTFTSLTQIDLAVTFVQPTDPEVPIPEPATGGAVAGVIGLAALAAGRRRSTSRAA